MYVCMCVMKFSTTKIFPLEFPTFPFFFSHFSFKPILNTFKKKKQKKPVILTCGNTRIPIYITKKRTKQQKCLPDFQRLESIEDTFLVCIDIDIDKYVRERNYYDYIR